MLQRLEAADRHAELLARLQIGCGDLDQCRHRTDGLGATRCDRALVRKLDHRCGPTDLAEPIRR